MQCEARFKNAADFTARQADIGKLTVRKLIQRLIGIAAGRPGGDSGQHGADADPNHLEGIAKGAATRGGAGGGDFLVNSLNRRGAGREAGFEIGEMRVHV